MDLSSPRGSSINDFISKEDYTLQYATFDQALALVASFGTGAFMAKLDLKHAFRLCAVSLDLPTRPPGRSGTHRSSILGLDTLAGHLAFLQSQAIAPSTRRAYQAGIHRYTSFCSFHLWNPFPASELQLWYFASWLSDQVSFPTIKLYLAGLRFAHIENSLADPFADAPPLHLLLRGIKHSNGLSSRRRLPITMSFVRQLKGALAADLQIPSQDKLMLWSAFTLAFFAFLRSSEFTSPSSTHFNSRVHLSRSDITFTSDGSLLLQLKSSKMDPFRKGCSITLAPSD